MSKDPYPHRERLDNPAGDQVIVPKDLYGIGNYRRPLDKYDTMYHERKLAGQIAETDMARTWRVKGKTPNWARRGKS